jgi:lipid-binding SYLF domain-containing protein
MRRALIPGCLVAILTLPPLVLLRAQAGSDEADRIREAATVLSEIASAPDKGIPNAVADKAEAIAVFPSVIKAGFVVGGHRGRGIISVRDRAARGWSPPAFLTLTGGSFGLQIGGEAADLVLVIMNRRGVEHLLQNQFKIGADTAVAAGPVGRDAEASTDIQLRAEILSYSRARGLFAGLTIKGSAIKEDTDANASFYGSPFRTREIVLDGKAKATPPADQWLDALTRFAR